MSTVTHAHFWDDPGTRIRAQRTDDEIVTFCIGDDLTVFLSPSQALELETALGRARVRRDDGTRPPVRSDPHADCDDHPCTVCRPKMAAGQSDTVDLAPDIEPTATDTPDVPVTHFAEATR